MSPPSYHHWLESNKSLRMDANEPCFKEARRQFHLSRYEFAVGHASGLRVLDAACGTGYGTERLAACAARVDGVDQSAEAIAWARHHYGRPNTFFQTACVESMPFEDSAFDLVVSFETIEHTLAPATAMWEFARVMAPGGTGIFSVPNHWGLTENHFTDFNQDLLEELLRCRFGEYRLYYNNSGTRKNRTAGIGPLESLPQGEAECLIVVCRDPLKAGLPADLHGYWINEMYENSFRRHREYLALGKSIPWLLRRFLKKSPQR